LAYFSSWQPLVDEDAHTALTFGFLRHAPVEAALRPWLCSVLGRSATAPKLDIASFWPTYRSIFKGLQWTEPELVFAADDGAPLTVVIEAKPGYGQQRREQVAREVVDTAHKTGAKRIVCVMVGADLGPPMPVGEWQQHVKEELEQYGLANVEAELRYASWASLGETAKACGASHPEWGPYADDVVQQLQRKVLMGYEGAPSLDDIEGGLTIANAAEAFRRTVEASRQYFLALHGQPRFQQLKLHPYWDTYRILRDGASTESPSAGAEYFQTTALVSLYRLADWPKTQAVFAGIYLGEEDAAQLTVGLGELAEHGETIVYRWAHSVQPDDGDDLGVLANVDPATFPSIATYTPGAVWAYDVESWVAGRPEDDLDWVLSKLKDAVEAWTKLTAAAL
jgi:hypothetical protein